MAQKFLVHPYYLVQMEVYFYLIKMLSWKRWAEHFTSVLNHPSSINDNAINRLAQIECNVLLDKFPTVTETRKTIQHLFSGKAPGVDATPIEV